MAAAAQKIDVVIGAKDLYSSRLKQAQAQFKGFGVGVGKAIKAGAVVAAAAIGTLIGVMYKGVQAANVQEDAETRLRQALGHTSTALLNQASALQQVTKYGDETIIQAQSLIASFVKDENQIKAATRATLDLAAAKGMDLKNAGDLVSKTLGSSTNALSRYGIQVEGAVGSTERLESLTKGIAAVFGGQASAQALTYAGRITQMKNAFGDVMEEIGFVITKNQFFNKAIAASTKLFAQWGQHIKNNRQYLMELAKTGIVGIVEGLGTAIEVMRFFHNGWLGLRLVGNATAMALADSLRLVNEAIRVVLAPLDVLFAGLVQFGAMETNPFDSLIDSSKELQVATRESGAAVLEDIETVNRAYDAAGSTVANFASQLRDMKVAAAEETPISTAAAGLTKPAGIPVTPASEDIYGPDLEEYKNYLQQKKLVHDQWKIQMELAAGEGDLWAGHQLELDALVLKNQMLLEIAWQQGASETEIATMHAEARKRIAQQEMQFKLGVTSQAMANMGNIAQAYYEMSGNKSKEAFKIMQAAKIAETGVNTYSAAMGAYNAMASIPYVGPVLGALAAGAAIAMGMKQVQQIKKMKPGGSVSGGGGATSGAGGYSPGGSLPSYGATDPLSVGDRREEERPTQQVIINVKALDPSEINWDNYSEHIVDTINRAGKERDVKITMEAVVG